MVVKALFSAKKDRVVSVPIRTNLKNKKQQMPCFKCLKEDSVDELYDKESPDLKYCAACFMNSIADEPCRACLWRTMQRLENNDERKQFFDQHGKLLLAFWKENLAYWKENLDLSPIKRLDDWLSFMHSLCTRAVYDDKCSKCIQDRKK
jgi:hypothetical protein